MCIRDRCGRTPGALPLLAVQRDQDGRARRLLDDPRCDDPDASRVPAFLSEPATIRAVALAPVPALAGLFQRGAIDLLAPAVHLLELPRDSVRLRLRLRQQQLDALHRVANAAGGVEAWRENEPNTTRRERPVVHPRCAHKRPESLMLSLIHISE